MKLIAVILLSLMAYTVARPGDQVEASAEPTPVEAPQAEVTEVEAQVEEPQAEVTEEEAQVEEPQAETSQDEIPQDETPEIQAPQDEPSETGAPQEEAPASSGSWYSGLFDTVKSAVSTATETLGSAADSLTSYLGFETSFTDALSAATQSIKDTLVQGGKLTVNLVARLVGKTLDTATNNNITTAEVAQRIKATFNVPGANGAQPLELADIDNLQIDGDAGKAAEFRESLVYCIVAQNAGNMSALQLLAVLECELVDLLAGNAIISSNGAANFKAMFNLDAILNTITNPKPALDSVANYYSNNVHPQLVGLSQAALDFLIYLKNQIAQSPVCQEIAQRAPGFLEASTNYTIALKNQIAESPIVQKIVAEAPAVYESSLNFASSVKNQIAQKAPEYTQYLANVKTQIANSAVAQTVAQKAPELYEEYVNYMSKLADQIVKSQIVQQVARKAPQYYNSTVNYINDLTTQLLEESSEQLEVSSEQTVA